MPKIKSMNQELTSESFEQEVLNNDQLAIVQFRNQWNGACQIMAPIYKELALSFKGRVEFFEVDIESEASLKKEYGIIEVPTILIFSRGELVDYSNGLVPRSYLIQKIEDALKDFK